MLHCRNSGDNCVKQSSSCTLCDAKDFLLREFRDSLLPGLAGSLTLWFRKRVGLLAGIFFAGSLGLFGACTKNVPLCSKLPSSNPTSLISNSTCLMLTGKPVCWRALFR